MKDLNPVILSISWPSASWKTALANALCHNYSALFQSITQTTTRPPREHDIDNKDYYFITEENYSKESHVVEIEVNGYNYGISQNEVDSIRWKIWIIACWLKLQKFLNNIPGVVHIPIHLRVDLSTARTRMFQRWDSFIKTITRLRSHHKESWFGEVFLRDTIF